MTAHDKPQRDVPYHMRDDSDDEADGTSTLVGSDNGKAKDTESSADAAAGPSSSPGKSGSANGKEKQGGGGLSKLFGRKVKVGKVEFDPEIGEPLDSEAC